MIDQGNRGNHVTPNTCGTRNLPDFEAKLRELVTMLDEVGELVVAAHVQMAIESLAWPATQSDADNPGLVQGD